MPTLSSLHPKRRARWVYFARGVGWHLVLVTVTPALERQLSGWVPLAPASLCRAARLVEGERWSASAPADVPYVRCGSCRILARKYLVTAVGISNA